MIIHLIQSAFKSDTANLTFSGVKSHKCVFFCENSGPAIVDKESEDAGESLPSVERQDPAISRVPSTPSPSLSEAEEQAVRILESAIEGASDIVSSKSSPEEGEEEEEATSITLEGSAVILNPDQGEDRSHRAVITPDKVMVSDSSAKGRSA